MIISPAELQEIETAIAEIDAAVDGVDAIRDPHRKPHFLANEAWVVFQKHRPLFHQKTEGALEAVWSRMDGFLSRYFANAQARTNIIGQSEVVLHLRGALRGVKSDSIILTRGGLEAMRRGFRAVLEAAATEQQAASEGGANQ